MEATKLEEQALREAIMNRSEDPLLVRLLETRNEVWYKKLTDFTLIVIYYSYPDNDVIRSRIQNMEDSLATVVLNRAEDHPLLVRLLEERIDFNQLTERTLEHIYYAYPATYTTIMSKVARASYRLWERMLDNNN